MRLALALLLAAAAARSAAAEPGSLFRVLQGGRWGFIDARGALVIAPRFERAGPFSEGLAAVVEGGRHGYVDRTGAMVLVPTFAPAAELHRPFRDGRAAVRQGRRLGYIDRSGALVIPARFGRADDFSGGLALACEEGLGCGYVDRAGRGVVGPGLVGGFPARDGVACGVVMEMMARRTVALYGADGRLLAGDLEGCGRLSEGLVAVRYRGLWGYLDATGRAALTPRFEWAGDFSGGLAPARAPGDERCGYVDREGRFAIPPRFRACHAFAEGRARVDLAEGDDADREAFIDAEGRVVVDGRAQAPGFDAADDFAGGLAAVATGGAPGLAGSGARLGYVDRAGRIVWIPQD